MKRDPAMSNQILFDALFRNNIELPKRFFTTSSGFMRWGKNNTYWAKAVEDGFIYGDYSTGMSEYVFPNKQNMSSNEWQKRKLEIERQRKIEAEKIRRKQIEVSYKAYKKWKELPFADLTHPYIKRKLILAYGIKQDGRNLVVPLYDVDGKLWNLQYIKEDGKKVFLLGGRTKECMFIFGKRPFNEVVLCEGYATGASIYQATGNTVAVAFNVGNLEKVLLALRKNNPNLSIIIGADNDIKENAPTNVGRDEAFRLAGLYKGVEVIVPHMKNNCKCDFNDLAVVEGLDEVRKQFKKEKDYV